jgi:cytoskeletal protein RodZ
MGANDSRDIGAELAKARLRKGLSLDDLSHRTKIKVLKLLAIERDDMTALHGGVFARGFLRAYAREVGCDPEEIVRRYRAAYEDSAAPATAANDRPPDSTAQISVDLPGAAMTDTVDTWSGRGWMISLVVVVVAAGGYWATGPLLTRISRETATVTPVTSAQQVGTASRPEVGTTGRPTDSQSRAASDAAPRELRIEGRSHGPSWLTATADGRRVIYRLLDEGERTQIDATQEVVLRIGDPSNFDLTINGLSARRLGAAGEAVTVSITPQNVRQFLAD